jgi:hypothetical protein
MPGSLRIRRARMPPFSFAALHPEMVVSLALNEPPAAGILIGVPDIADLLKDWGNGLAPAREALKAGDVKAGIPLFVNGVGGPGAYERRSDADKKMNLESVRRLQAGLQSFRSMRRIEARRKNASAFRLRFSQSLASLRQRLSHAMVRSTIQRFGKTTNPRT